MLGEDLKGSVKVLEERRGEPELDLIDGAAAAEAVADFLEDRPNDGMTGESVRV